MSEKQITHDGCLFLNDQNLGSIIFTKAGGKTLFNDLLDSFDKTIRYAVRRFDRFWYFDEWINMVIPQNIQYQSKSSEVAYKAERHESDPRWERERTKETDRERKRQTDRQREEEEAEREEKMTYRGIFVEFLKLIIASCSSFSVSVASSHWLYTRLNM